MIDTIQTSETILKSTPTLKIDKVKALNKKDPKKARETDLLIPYCQNFLVNVFFARYWLYGCFSI
ncbi:hypothetical protein DB320_03255 [Helicobacter pylori]|uniref:hypothetical protein n=1 Tax=Helicobacter pylori TaxID=210 RepID=UPI000EB14B71|nr:hypothetical protein [Helicobacter pylori]RKU89709.1 hypothetical protein DB320_03255 [Helicobacter pylori]